MYYSSCIALNRADLPICVDGHDMIQRKIGPNRYSIMNFDCNMISIKFKKKLNKKEIK